MFEKMWYNIVGYGSVWSIIGDYNILRARLWYNIVCCENVCNIIGDIILYVAKTFYISYVI